MVNVEGLAACRNGAAGVFGDGNGARADVVVDLDVLIVFEGELDGEVDLDGVVMNAALFSLTAFDAVKLILLVHLGAGKAVVVNLGVLHPDGEDASSGDSAFYSGLASSFPAPAGVDKFAVVDFETSRGLQPNAGPEDVFNLEIVQVKVLAGPSVDGTVDLGPGEGEIGDGDVG